MHSFGWCVMLLEFGLEMLPEVFNGIEVRGLGRPLQGDDVIVRKPLICLFGGVLWVIVLLKVPLILSHLQTFKALLHSLLQNLTILLTIHDPLSLYQLPHPIPTHTSPNHQVNPPSMLDSWCGGPV